MGETDDSTARGERHEIARRPIVLRHPAEAGVRVVRDLTVREGSEGPLTIDVYRPPAVAGERPAPAVLFVVAGSDAGARRMLGCTMKEMESYASWARLVAASGMVAITHGVVGDPVADARASLAHVRARAGELGVDPGRVAIWSCSGNGPTALALLLAEPVGSLRCAALVYAYTLDLDGVTAVADGLRQYRMPNPSQGRGVEELPAGTPLLVVRAGSDETPGLNQTLDAFVTRALARNLPVTVSNHPDLPHAFDVLVDGAESRRAVRGILAHLGEHLLGEPPVP
jgi:acetyl esterase/lipase